MNQPFFFCADLAAQLPLSGSDTIVSRVIYRDEQVRATLFAFAAGQELSEHSTSQRAVLHFLQGEADVTLGEKQLSVKAGSWAYLEPNLKHSVFAKSDVQMLLLMIKPNV